MMPSSSLPRCDQRPPRTPGHSHGHIAIAALGAWLRVEKTGVEDLVEDASVIGWLKK
jgi:hypothetical protein